MNDTAKLRRVICKVILCVIAFLPNIIVRAQQPIDKIAGLMVCLKPPDSAAFHDDTRKKVITNILEEITFLREKEQEQKSLKGSIKFSFNGDKNKGKELTKFNAGITLTRGNYPGKLTINNEIGMTNEDGTFKEDVTNLHISYDYHPHFGDSLWIQNYIYVDRFSDNFLGIDQRYELGGGTILACWSSRLTPEGVKETEKLKKYEFDTTDYDKSILKKYLAKCEGKDDLKSLTNEDVLTLKETQNRANLSIKKEYSRLRLGILWGIFYETNKITIKDTVDTLTLKATNKLRWELRPTFVYQYSDHLLLSIKPYFKFGMPLDKEWYSTVEFGSHISRKTDYRIDFQSSLKIKFSSSEEFQGSLPEIELSYRVLYENAPGRAYVQHKGQNGELYLFKTPNTHQILKLSFAMSF